MTELTQFDQAQSIWVRLSRRLLRMILQIACCLRSDAHSIQTRQVDLPLRKDYPWHDLKRSCRARIKTDTPREQRRFRGELLHSSSSLPVAISSFNCAIIVLALRVTICTNRSIYFPGLHDIRSPRGKGSFLIPFCCDTLRYLYLATLLTTFLYFSLIFPEVIFTPNTSFQAIYEIYRSPCRLDSLKPT